MAIVQSSGKRQADGVSSSSSFNAPGNFTAGNTVIVTVAHYVTGGSRISGVTVNGQAAVLDKRRTGSGAPAQSSADIWRCTNVPGGGSGFVITYGGGSDNFVSCGVDEHSGFTASPLDQTGEKTSGTGTAPTVSTTGAITQANETVYAVAENDDGTSSAGWSTPSGYTQSWVEQDSNSHQGGQASYRILSGAPLAVQAATWGHSSGVASVAVIATYKMASGSDTALAGSGSAVTAVSAALSTGIRPAASVTATTSVTGALTTAIRMARVLTVQTTVTGALSTPIRLGGAASAQTTITAALSSGAASLQASVSGVVTVVGALSTSVRLAGSVASVATVSGSFTTAIRPAAAVQSSVTISGSLTTGIRLAGAVSSTVNVTAALPGTAAALAGSVSCACAVSASLSTAVRLAAQVIANAQATAALSTAIRMSAQVSARTLVSGTLPLSETDLSDEWIYTVPGESLAYDVPGDDLRITL